MNINEYGVFDDYKTLELPKKQPKGWDTMSEGIILNYGEHNNMWGFSLSYIGKNEGFGMCIDRTDMVFLTKNGMLDNAREEIVKLCDRYFKGNLTFKTGHLDFLLSKIKEQWLICCERNGKEPLWINVFSRDVNSVFKEISDRVEDTVESFKFMNEDKKHINPFYEKKETYIQGELF